MGTRIMRLFLSGVLMVAFLAACGGGGGGDTIPNITYEGNSTPAMISNSNAEELVLAAYEGGDFSGSTIVIMSTEGGSGSSGVSVPLILARIVSAELAKKAAGGSVSALSTTEEQGHCTVNPNGIVTTVMNDDYIYTGALSGSMTFNNYCQEVGVNTEVVMNGKVTVSGTFSVDDYYDPTFVTVNQNELYHYITMDTYDVTGGTPARTESLTIAGQMAASSDIDLNTYTMNISATANLGMKDNDSGKTFKVENYCISMSSDVFSGSVSISGRFYHWAHGYVDISTPTAIQIDTFYAHPLSGVFRIDASNGSWAELTFLNYAQYQIAGEDGTGTPFNTGTLDW